MYFSKSLFVITICLIFCLQFGFASAILTSYSTPEELQSLIDSSSETMMNNVIMYVHYNDFFEAGEVSQVELVLHLLESEVTRNITFSLSQNNAELPYYQILFDDSENEARNYFYAYWNVTADEYGILDFLLYVKANVNQVINEANPSLKLRIYDSKEPAGIPLDTQEDVATIGYVVLDLETEEELLSLFAEETDIGETNFDNMISDFNENVDVSRERRTTSTYYTNGEEIHEVEYIFVAEPNEGVEEYYILEYIPKEIVESSNDIFFLNEEPIILQEDPMIMWHFNEQKEVSYTVNSNSNINSKIVGLAVMKNESLWRFDILIPIGLAILVAFIIIYFARFSKLKKKN